MKNSSHGQMLRKAPLLDLERVLILIAIFALIFFFVDAAHAASTSSLGGKALDDTALGKGIQSLVEVMNGKIARAIAVLGIIGMGIGALTGRVEWSKVFIVLIGVGIVFSASAIVTALFDVAAT